MHVFWPYVVVGIHLVFALVASGHAVLSKRDTRGAIGWVAVIWLAPLLGVMLYIWLGINRIERRARSLRTDQPRVGSSSGLCPCPTEILDQALTPGGIHLKHLIALVRDVSRRPLLAGNRVTPLVNGDQAYPAMLQAIDEASRFHAVDLHLPSRLHGPTVCGCATLCRPSQGRSAGANRRRRSGLQLATDAARAPTGGNPLRPVHAYVDPLEVSLLEPEKPPKDHGDRWKGRFHGRHQYR